MKKLTYKQLTDLFCDHEKDRPKTHLHGAIVFTKDSFKKDYPLDSRTYLVSSDNKAFQPNMGGYSIYGSSKDGSDICVRLESYMQDEHGGKDGWKVDYCYLIDKKEAC